MEAQGFDVVFENVEDMTPIKTQYGVPAELHSCHTAIVDGYVIEGHVPAEDIRRLLTERPAIIGLAVAGMPPGSPGMGSIDGPSGPFDVVAFDAAGGQRIFATYP